MPRRARVASTTGYYHVIMRGNNREYIFKHQRSKQFYKHHLFRYQEEGYYSIAGWCIMDNHVHLILYSAEIETLSKGLHDLNLVYAQHYHKDKRSVGHVFQDRFISENVEDDNYLMQVIRYVHNNPVKAKMVDKVQDYKWSSYSAYRQNILTESMRFTYSLFDYQWDRFNEYHQQEDENEYLEIKEDVEKYRNEKAQKIISDICQLRGVYDIDDINRRPEIIDVIISELIKSSGLSLNKIAKFLGLSYSRVQRNRR